VKPENSIKRTRCFGQWSYPVLTLARVGVARSIP
jgi:hypothetical protein